MLSVAQVVFGIGLVSILYLENQYQNIYVKKQEQIIELLQMDYLLLKMKNPLSGCVIKVMVVICDV